MLRYGSSGYVVAKSYNVGSSEPKVRSQENKRDESHIERTSFGATFMYHSVTNPFIGAFRYRGTLKKRLE